MKRIVLLTLGLVLGLFLLVGNSTFAASPTSPEKSTVLTTVSLDDLTVTEMESFDACDSGERDDYHNPGQCNGSGGDATCNDSENVGDYCFMARLFWPTGQPGLFSQCCMGHDYEERTADGKTHAAIAWNALEFTAGVGPFKAGDVVNGCLANPKNLLEADGTKPTTFTLFRPRPGKNAAIFRVTGRAETFKQLFEKGVLVAGGVVTDQKFAETTGGYVGDFVSDDKLRSYSSTMK